MRINSNLKTLIDTKNVSVRKVARDIEYRLGAVQDMYNNTMERYPRDLLTKLCVYFNCSIGDILEITNDEH
ncbi:helix-turn-helix transcriptional regulator [Paenibacillus sp. HWE-109]|uniref:helix-turn-helix domain-containing protein n=1 Tax=Paenibacillus sp. HWE-109 TaxID=1306526 RepID=UPI001EE10375|nr:helix-turn-helix transcriptional regulator [Paenibacillus sp. HWE-109]UKS30178.1 helix-turn-helix transcriptional regulator [Paenibacillus sp. HWE-109]